MILGLFSKDWHNMNNIFTRTDNTPTLFGVIAEHLTRKYINTNGYSAISYKTLNSWRYIMNYMKIYNDLMAKSKNRSLEYEKYAIDNKIKINNPKNQGRFIKKMMNEKYGYIEIHHIIPKKDGGLDCISNYAFLTAEEHVIAHHLLYRAVPTKKHFLAWHFLTMSDHSGVYKKRLTPKQHQELMIKNKEIASNRIITEETRKKLSKRSTENNGMCGKSWYNDGKTNIVSVPGEEPKGFIKGRLDVIPEDKKHSTTGYIWYNNGKVNTSIKNGDTIPEGFVKGILPRGKFYTNGKINKRFKEGDKIPDGFYEGYTDNRIHNHSTRGKKCYTNGIRNIYLFDNDTIPKGFVKGSFNAPNKGNVLYNNGLEQITIKPGMKIPDDFVKGKLNEEVKNED